MAIEQMTFTVVQGGKGLNPSLPTGYQVKGCSPGLQKDASLRDRIAAICTHYGQVVYDGKSSAVAAAMNKESAWYRQQQRPLQAFGPQVLDEFPVVWSYAQPDNEWWSVTRICYRGPCPEGKPGNFFAHALVFRPEELQRHGHNPLALCRSSLFMACDPGDSTILPTLGNLGNSSAACLDADLLGRAPWRDRVGAILLALAQARLGGRPVALCMPNWREVPAFVEGLLALLPPSARCRTAVCTFENDPHWIPSFHGPPQRGATAAHHLLVLCGEDDKVWNLYPEDYESRFVVFNFVGNQFSELPEARAFAAFTVDCLQRNDLPKIEQYHRLMERFDAERDAGTWNPLAQAADLLDVRSQARDFAAAADALLALAKGARQATVALDVLLPWLPALAAADNHQALNILASRLVALAERMPAEYAALQPIGKMIRPLAASALAAGQGRSLAALLRGCGAEEDAILLDVTKNLLPMSRAEWTRTPDARDQEALFDLMLRALRVAWAKLPGDPAISPLIVIAFRAAAEAGKTAEAWRQSAKIVRSVLAGPWDEQQRRAAQELARYLPSGVCPQGNAWLNKELLFAEKPQGEELLSRLQSIAEACGKYPEGDEIVSQLVTWVVRTSTAVDLPAIALGRMAEATMGTALMQKVFEQYCRARNGITAEQLAQVRRQLALAGASKVLLRDIFEETRSWREGSQKQLQVLFREILGSNPRILPGLCSELTMLLAQPESREHSLRLAQHILKSHLEQKPSGPWLAELLAAMADAIPFGPMTEEYRKAFADLPAGMETPVTSRLRFMKFMGDVESASTKPGWSLAHFPHDHAAWREMHRLSPDEQSQVIAWCDDHLLRLRIATPEDAKQFVGLLQAVGRDSEEAIIDVVQRMLYGRDSVTCVVAATAFAYCGKTNSRPLTQEQWSAVANAIVGKFKRRTRKLYKAHLDQLFYQPNLRKWKRVPALSGTRGSDDAAMTYIASRAKASPWRRVWRHPWIIASLAAVVLLLVGVGSVMIWREPKNAEAYCSRGNDYAKKGEFKQALADYAEAIRHDPDYAEAYLDRAAAREKMNDLDALIEDYSKLILLRPHEANAWESKLVDFYNDRVKTFELRKDHNKAILDLSEVIRLRPNDAKAYRERARLYETHESDKAIADYTEAIRFETTMAETTKADMYRRRGIVLTANHEYDKALADLTEAIRLNSEDAKAYFARGMVYRCRSDFTKAIADFTDAIRLNPNDAEAYYARGTVQLDQHDYAKAIADFTDAIRLDGRLAKAYFERGSAYKAQHDDVKAQADFDQAEKLGYRPE